MKSILPILLLFAVASQAQKKVEFPNIGNLVDTNTMQLKTGAHRIVIKKTVGRSISYDTVSLMIMPDTNSFSVNYMPSAFAGNDTTWTFGKTVTVKGIGFDPDGSITSYKWSRTGPKLGKISFPTRATTTLTGLGKGVHNLTLRVTDNNGGFAIDTLKITVQ